MSATYGPETTITVGMLCEGDWIDTVPTQSGVRGVIHQSAVEHVMEDTADLDWRGVWSAGNGRGRRRTVIESVVIRTRRGLYCLPVDFTVVVRRPVPGDLA